MDLQGSMSKIKKQDTEIIIQLLLQLTDAYFPETNIKTISTIS